MTRCASISLLDDGRIALEANRPCNNDYVLAWNRAQAFFLLDAKEDPETIYQTLSIDQTDLAEWICDYSADRFASFGLKDYSEVSISLGAEQRAETKAICLRRKVDNLVWKRAQAIIFLDAKEDPQTICRTLDIDLTVLTGWVRAYFADGLASLGLKDYSQASISLSDEQRAEIKAICRRRKVDALVWRRARAIDLLGARVDPETICQIHWPDRSDGMAPCLFGRRVRVLRSEGLQPARGPSDLCSGGGTEKALHRTSASQSWSDLRLHSGGV